MRERLFMGALGTLELQRKEMDAAIKKLLKAGELEIEDEDLDKAEYLLHKHPVMDSIIKDYEYSMVQWENGMSEYSMANAQGKARHGEHGRELRSDVTADAVVLKHKSEAIYHLYKTISHIIRSAIEHLKDPHEHVIFTQMFIEGKRCLDVLSYMERGYRSDLHPIASTTFYDKRRRAMKKITASLKLAGVLDIIQEDTRQVRLDKSMVYRLAFAEWD